MKRIAGELDLLEPGESAKFFQEKTEIGKNNRFYSQTFDEFHRLRKQMGISWSFTVPKSPFQVSVPYEKTGFFDFKCKIEHVEFGMAIVSAKLVLKPGVTSLRNVVLVVFVDLNQSQITSTCIQKVQNGDILYCKVLLPSNVAKSDGFILYPYVLWEERDAFSFKSHREISVDDFYSFYGKEVFEKFTYPYRRKLRLECSFQEAEFLMERIIRPDPSNIQYQLEGPMLQVRSIKKEVLDRFELKLKSYQSYQVLPFKDIQFMHELPSEASKKLSLTLQALSQTIPSEKDIEKVHSALQTAKRKERRIRHFLARLGNQMDMS